MDQDAGPSNSADMKPAAKQESGDSAVTLKDKPEPKDDFTIYQSADEIQYAPEHVFREGNKMVKAIDANLKKVKLGSKLRQEVWRKEISTYAYTHYNGIATDVDLQAEESDVTHDSDRCLWR